MKKLELEPTIDNLLTALKLDVTGRNENIVNFINMLDKIPDSCAISINGDWGSGKTFFVKQVEMLLAYYNLNLKNEILQFKDELNAYIEQDNIFNNVDIEKNYVPIYYNAWDNDSHEDPVLSLLYYIIKKKDLQGYDSIPKSLITKLGAIVEVFNVYTSGSITKLIESFKTSTETDSIKTMEDAKDTLKTLLKEVLLERGDRLIIFIDELDRCNPVYAVKILERIKHFFNNENIIFVFSTNIRQLNSTILKYYGDEFDSNRYLNKFFDLQFEIPDIDVEKYIKNLNAFDRTSYYFDEIIYIMVKYFKFSMRDCNRFLQMISIVREYILTDRDGFSDTRGFEFVTNVFVPILLALKISNLKLYTSIIEGKDYDSFLKIITDSNYIVDVITGYMNTNELSIKPFDRQLLNIYDTLFSNDNEKTYFGNNMKINKKTKYLLMDLMGMMSKHSKF